MEGMVGCNVALARVEDDMLLMQNSNVWQAKAAMHLYLFDIF